MTLGYMYRAQPTMEGLSSFDLQSLCQTLSGRHGGQPPKLSLAPSPSGATELIFCSSNPTTINRTVNIWWHSPRIWTNKDTFIKQDIPRLQSLLLRNQGQRSDFSNCSNCLLQGQIVYCTLKNFCVCFLMFSYMKNCL